MTEQWNELKETIIELRDNDGTGTQQEVCEFLTNYINLLERQIQTPSDSYVNRQEVVNTITNTCFWLSADNWSELMKCISSIPPVSIDIPIKSEWVSVDDMLPKEDVRVLVCNKHGDMEVSTGWNGVTEKKWHWDADGYYGFGDVVAWRPLPEPYKMKEEE